MIKECKMTYDPNGWLVCYVHKCKEFVINKNRITRCKEFESLSFWDRLSKKIDQFQANHPEEFQQIINEVQIKRDESRRERHLQGKRRKKLAKMETRRN